MNHSDRTEMTERIRRITEMESRYDRVRHALRASGACPGCLDSIRDDIRALSAYYEDSLWREDFEADEAGLLPPDLKRGVLSEDGVYNLLSDYAELNDRLPESVQKEE